METRGNLKIDGNMTFPGGLFQDILVNGHATIDGDISCVNYHVNGDLHIAGNATVECGKVNGRVRIDGNVNINECKVYGDMKTSGSIRTNNAKIHGKMIVGQDINADSIKLRGRLEVNGDCNTEKFDSDGSFKIDGLLNSDYILIGLGSKCRVREMGGEKIEVRNSKDLLGLTTFIKSTFLPKEMFKLEVDVVEGDHIYLENTTAKVVRGNYIEIGQNCEIDIVEYEKEFKSHESAKIRSVLSPKIKKDLA